MCNILFFILHPSDFIYFHVCSLFFYAGLYIHPPTHTRAHTHTHTHTHTHCSEVGQLSLYVNRLSAGHRGTWFDPLQV